MLQPEGLSLIQPASPAGFLPQLLPSLCSVGSSAPVASTDPRAVSLIPVFLQTSTAQGGLYPF